MNMLGSPSTPSRNAQQPAGSSALIVGGVLVDGAFLACSLEALATWATMTVSALETLVAVSVATVEKILNFRLNVFHEASFQ